MNEGIASAAIFFMAMWLLFAFDAMLDKLMRDERGEAREYR